MRIGNVVVDPAIAVRGVFVDPVASTSTRRPGASRRRAQRLLEYLETATLRVQGVLETHQHADHFRRRVDALSHDRETQRNRPSRHSHGVQRTFKTRLELGDDSPADGREFDSLLGFTGDGARWIDSSTPRVIATPGTTSDSRQRYHRRDAGVRSAPPYSRRGPGALRGM